MRETIARLLDSMRRDKLDRELKEELRFHHEQLKRDLANSNSSNALASHAAAQRMGNITSVREAARERWSIPWMDNLQQDVRYAARGLLRNRGFTTIVVLTLAIGLGANAAVFSLLSRIFSDAPAGMTDTATLRRLYASSPQSPELWDGFNYPQWRDLQIALAGHAATAFAPDSVRIGGEDDPETVGVTYADASYWS
ncbi:MAG: hypothetical protein ABI852_19125, partial [Gemmatimonadaceae bacterium]